MPAGLPDLPVVWYALASLHLEVADEARRRLQLFADLLVRRGGITGTTAVTDIEGVQRRHLAEPLALAAFLRDHGLAGGEASRIIDVGSGAGLPGIPIAIVFPGMPTTLLEATARKAGFLREAVAAIDLDRVDVVAERAEKLGRSPDHREQYDLAVSRAVAPLPVLVELCLPLLHIGGSMVAIKGSRVEDEVSAADAAIETLGGRSALVERLAVPGGEARLSVVVIEKGGATPDTYPRRPGTPSKRPIGATKKRSGA